MNRMPRVAARMRILLLNLYYPPDTSATAKMAATVAEALSERNDVTVLCGRPSYDPNERRPWRLWQTETAGRVKIVRVGSTDYPRFAMKRRVLNYLSYVALAIPRALFVRCDVGAGDDRPSFRRNRRSDRCAAERQAATSTTFATCIRTWRWAEQLSSQGCSARIWETIAPLGYAARHARNRAWRGHACRIVAKGVNPAMSRLFAMARIFFQPEAPPAFAG